MPAETSEKFVDECSEAEKPAKALRRRMLCSEKLLAPIASYVPAKTVKAIANQQNVGILKNKPMQNCVNRNASAALETSHVQEA